jgi:hypothetical protein
MEPTAEILPQNVPLSSGPGMSECIYYIPKKGGKI